MFSIDVTENLIINLRKERGRGIVEIVEENREGTGAQIISLYFYHQFMDFVLSLTQFQNIVLDGYASIF